MSTPVRTTRDQLMRVTDVLRRALRYWWLVGAVGVVGACLSVVFALRQPQLFESETVLLYQERMSQSVLQGREVIDSSRKLAGRYHEMVLSRTNLAAIVEELKLLPDVLDKRGPVAAAEELRQRIKFRDRGAGTFRISFLGDTPREAQAVTQRLAERLQEEDRKIRREQAEQTKDFLEEEKQRADDELKTREIELTQFLTLHPEFAEDTGTGGDKMGAAILAAQNKKTSRIQGDPRLNALERQRRRIWQRLENPTAPVVVRKATPRPESPAVRQARQEVEKAQRELESALARLTPKHPDVSKARNAVSAAEQRLKRIEAEDAANQPEDDSDDLPIPATVDKDALRAQLTRIENEIAILRSRDKDGPKSSETAKSSSLADELVNRETEFARLTRKVQEGRERIDALESRVFAAEITASSEFAEAAALIVIDEAFLPVRAAGRGRGILAMAGTLVFAALGCMLALGLAVIDDRIYRRHDLDDLGIAPVLVVVPKLKKAGKRG